MGQLAAYDDFRSGFYKNRTKTEEEILSFSFAKTLDGTKEISYQKVMNYLESIPMLKSSKDLFTLQSLAEDIILFLKSQGYREIV